MPDSEGQVDGRGEGKPPERGDSTVFGNKDLEREIANMDSDKLPSAPVEKFTAGDMRKLADKYRASLGPEKLMALQIRLVDDNQNITLERKKALEGALQKIGQGMHPAMAAPDELWDCFEKAHILEGQVKEIKRFTQELKSQNQGQIPQEYLQPLKEFAERLEAVGRDTNFDCIMPDALKPMAIEKGWIKLQSLVEETQFALPQGIDLAASGAVQKIAHVFGVTPNEEWIKHKAREDFDVMEFKGTDEEKESYLVTRAVVNGVIDNVLTSYGIHQLGLTEEQINAKLRAAFPQEQDEEQQPKSGSLEGEVAKAGNAVLPEPGSMPEVLRDAQKYSAFPSGRQPGEQGAGPTEPQEGKTRVSIKDAYKHASDSYLVLKGKDDKSPIAPLLLGDVEEIISKHKLLRREGEESFVELEDFLDRCRVEGYTKIPDTFNALEAFIHNRGGISGSGRAGERIAADSLLKKAKPIFEEEYKKVLSPGNLARIVIGMIDYARIMAEQGTQSSKANEKRVELMDLINQGLEKVSSDGEEPAAEEIRKKPRARKMRTAGEIADELMHREPVYMKIPLLGNFIRWVQERRKPAESEEVEPAPEPQPAPQPITTACVEPRAEAEPEPSSVPEQVPEPAPEPQPEPELSDAQLKAYLSEGLAAGAAESAEPAKGIPPRNYVNTFDELLDQLALDRLEGKNTRESVRMDFIPDSKRYAYPAINVELDEKGNVQYHSAGKFDVEANRNLLEKVLVSGISPPVWLYVDDWCEQNGITDETSREALNQIIAKYSEMAEEAGLPKASSTFEGKPVIISTAADTILETYNKLAQSLEAPKQGSTTIFNVVRYVNGQSVLEGEFAEWAYESLGLGPAHAEEKSKVDSVLREYTDKNGVPTAAGKGIKETDLDELLEKCRDKIDVSKLPKTPTTTEEIAEQTRNITRILERESLRDEDVVSLYNFVKYSENLFWAQTKPVSDNPIAIETAELNRKYQADVAEAVNSEAATGKSSYHKRLLLAVGRLQSANNLRDKKEVLIGTEAQKDVEQADKRAREAEAEAEEQRAEAEEQRQQRKAVEAGLNQLVDLLGTKDLAHAKYRAEIEKRVSEYARLDEEQKAELRRKSEVIKKKDEVISKKDYHLRETRKKLHETAKEAAEVRMTASELEHQITKERAKSRSYLRAGLMGVAAAALITAATIMYGIPALNKYINTRKEADELYTKTLIELRDTSSEAVKDMKLSVENMKKAAGYDKKE